jgi:hypothetical protein
MAITIRKVSELKQVEELSPSSNVIIEENGEAKRFSISDICRVKTINGIKPDENGNIEIDISGSNVEIPEINFPVTSVNGMTGDVVIDATSNFSGSWNDLTDKPFYEEDGSVVELYKNENLAFAESENQEDVLYISQVVEGVAFEDGKTYRINWDGSEYVCDCMLVMSDDEFSVLFIGNLSLMSPEAPNSGEPFLIECVYGMEHNVYMCAIGTTSTLSTHSVVISGETSVVTALDEKFIPDTIARKADVTWENLPDKPFGEELVVGEEIFPETTLDFQADDQTQAYGLVVATIELDRDMIEDGKTYNFVIDGISYETKPVFGEGEDEGQVMLGNAALMVPELEDNGLPFAAGFVTYGSGAPADILAIFLVGDSDAQHTVSISVGGSSIKYLDEIYIPDTIARKSDIPNDEHIIELINAKLAETTLPSAEGASF